MKNVSGKTEIIDYSWGRRKGQGIQYSLKSNTITFRCSHKKSSTFLKWESKKMEPNCIFHSLLGKKSKTDHSWKVISNILKIWEK